MNPTTQVLRINFIILALYTVAFHFIFGQETLISSIVPIALQVGGNLIAGIATLVTQQKGYSKGFLLSSLLVLLIGFGTCWLSTGIASTWDKGSGTSFH